MRSVNRNDCVMRTSSCDVLEERESRNPFLFSFSVLGFLSTYVVVARGIDTHHGGWMDGWLLFIERALHYISVARLN